MEQSLALRLLRDVAAVLVVGIFMFPLFWWALTSIKPISAIFNKDEVVFFDFDADPDQLCGGPARQVARGAGHRDRQRPSASAAPAPTIRARPSSIRSSSHRLHRPDDVRRGARRLCPVAHERSRAATPISTGSWRSASCRRSPSSCRWCFMFHYMGLRDTTICSGLYRSSSLRADQPADRRAADEVVLRRRAEGGRRGRDDRRRHALPDLPQGGAADGDAAASPRPPCCASSSPGPSSCCRCFSPPSSARVPVKISTFVTSTGSEWGFISALGTAAIVPSFIFILLVQRHLVRGLTLGSLKE